jgi:sulfate adenylyltransferase
MRLAAMLAQPARSSLVARRLSIAASPLKRHVMIRPVGSDELKPLFVYDPDVHHRLMREAEDLPSVTISSQAAGNAVMMGAGYFTPLPGFMNLADALSVAETMQTTLGKFFPVPVLCLVEDADAARISEALINGAQVDGAQVGGYGRVALRDPNMDGNPVLAIMDLECIEPVSDAQMAMMTERVYGTLDTEHPGVAAFSAQGRTALSGPIQVLHFSYFQDDFPDTFRTAVEIRNEIVERGWKRVVAFQTRNPMHLAHEELCHMAMERLECDGLVIHMLLGKLKPGDIPAPVRDAAIRKMV